MQYAMDSPKSNDDWMHNHCDKRKSGCQREFKVLDDDMSAELLRTVMLKQKLRKSFSEHPEFTSQLRQELILAGSPSAPSTVVDISEYTNADHGNGSGDFLRSFPLVQQQHSVAEGNGQEMVVLAEVIAELIEHENLSLGSEENQEQELIVFNQSLSESFEDWVRYNGSDVTRMISIGSQIAGQLAIGHVGGYMCASVIKKIGKPVLCSLGGGALILAFAHSKGFVSVDWDKIYKRRREVQIQSQEQSAASGSELDDEGQQRVECEVNSLVNGWLSDKLYLVGRLAKENSILTTGFLIGFAWKTFFSRSRLSN